MIARARLALAFVACAACSRRQSASPPSEPPPAPSSAAVAAAQGQLTPEVTDAILSGAIGSMQSCYVAQTRRTPSFHPKLDITLHLMPDGGVGAVKFDQPVPKPFADCMTTALGALHFPSGNEDVDFPLDLSQ